MSPWFRATTACLLLLPSCSMLSGGKKSKGEDKAEATARKEGLAGALADARAGARPLVGNGIDGVAVPAGGNVAPTPIQMTRNEDIAWTDPDHPEKGIPELSALMAAPKKDLWEDNESIARQRSVRDGKPLLIWFTDSGHNPVAQLMTAQLFDRPDFQQWVKEKFVRLRIDASGGVKDPNLSMQETDDKNAEYKRVAAEMTRRYKILGYPALVVISQNDDVIGRYKGYKSGQGDYTWGLLRQAEGLATKSGNAWRKTMMEKGYREWQDRSGNKVFAKLTAYAKGELYLVEPSGRRSRTNENRLSDPDREWIKQQKIQRGLQ